MNDEQQWLTATDSYEMLEYLEGRASQRKLRLLAVACCRRILHLTADKRSRRAFEVAERYADGFAGEEELAQARAGADAALRDSPLWGMLDSDADLEAAAAAVRSDGFDAAEGALWNACWHPCFMSDPLERERRNIPAATPLPSFEDERQAQCDLLRDLFGNPFRPLPPLTPSLLTWNGGLVVQLAQAAYEERLLPEGNLDPARLAVLADAVEETGRAHEELLQHLRQQGQAHVRGCWAVDLLLGRS